MREGDVHHFPRTETELVSGEEGTGTTDRASAMLHAELSRNDDDVTRLLLGHEAKRFRSPSVTPKRLDRDLAVPVVVERAGGLELLEGEEDTPNVAFGRVRHLREMHLGHGIDRRNGEPSFGTLRERERREDLVQELRRVAQRERVEPGDDVHLRGDRLRSLVLLRVLVARTHFLVLEQVLVAVAVDELRDEVGEARRVVDTLGFIVREASLVIGGFYDRDELETLGVPCGDCLRRRSQCLGHRSHLLF